MPILGIALFSWLGSVFTVTPKEEEGQVICFPSPDKADQLQAASKIWIVLYFFIPAIALTILNTAIMVRLWKMHRVYITLMKQHAALRMNGVELSSTSNGQTQTSSMDSHSERSYSDSARSEMQVSETDVTRGSADSKSKNTVPAAAGPRRNRVHSGLR